MLCTTYKLCCLVSTQYFSFEITCVGLVLFEMATGQVMRTPHLDEEMSRLHRPIAIAGVVPILESIFDTQSASLSSLLGLPFFQVIA